MAKLDMSHEEVWDDSALVKSWNEALEEYKKYHSLAAKGEKVDVVALEQAEKQAAQAASEAEHADVVDAAVTNGEVAEAVGAAEEPTPHTQAQQAAVGTGMKPQTLMNSVQDEGLKNLMMSWYYAGYYTGLYEGQQKAYASMQQPS